MGYGRGRLLWQVELPLALPAIMAGLRVATVSTVALATVGVIVGNGGLGQLIFGGFNSNFYRAEILTAVAADGRARRSPLDLLLALAERAADAVDAGAGREQPQRRLRLAQRPAELAGAAGGAAPDLASTSPSPGWPSVIAAVGRPAARRCCSGTPAAAAASPSSSPTCRGPSRRSRC